MHGSRVRPKVWLASWLASWSVSGQLADSLAGSRFFFFLLPSSFFLAFFRWAGSVRSLVLAKNTSGEDEHTSGEVGAADGTRQAYRRKSRSAGPPILARVGVAARIITVVGLPSPP